MPVVSFHPLQCRKKEFKLLNHFGLLPFGGRNKTEGDALSPVQSATLLLAQIGRVFGVLAVLFRFGRCRDQTAVSQTPPKEFRQRSENRAGLGRVLSLPNDFLNYLSLTGNFVSDHCHLSIENLETFISI
jgi:hypothetical protein